MAKLKNTIDTLNSINENTEDTNKSVKELIKQDQKQDADKKKQEKLDDKDDKKKGGLARILSGATKGVAETSKGIFGQIGDFFKTLGGLAALQFLMDPRFQEKLNNFVTKIKEFAEGLPKWADNLAAVSIGVGAFVASLIAAKAALLPVLGVKAVKAVTGRATGGGLEEARKIKAEQIEAERIKRAQRIIKDPATSGKVFKTDIGDLKVDPKSGRIKDATTNKFVNTKTGLNAIEKATPKTLGERLAPDDSFRRRAINKTAEIVKAPMRAISGSGRGSVVEAPGARAASVPTAKPVATESAEDFLKRAIRRTEMAGSGAKGAAAAVKAGAKTAAKGALGAAGKLAAPLGAALTVSDVGQVAAEKRAQGQEQSVAGNLLEGVTSLVGGIAALSDIANNYTNMGINKVLGTELKTDYDLAGQVTGGMRDYGYAGIEKVGADQVVSEGLNTGVIVAGKKVDDFISSTIDAFSSKNSAETRRTQDDFGAMGSVGIAPVVQNNNYGQYMMAPQTSVKTPLD